MYKNSAKDSLILFTQIHLSSVKVSLRYSSQSIQFIYLTCTIQWPLVYSQTYEIIIRVNFRTFSLLPPPKPHTLWLPPPHFCYSSPPFLLLILLCILFTCGFHCFLVLGPFKVLQSSAEASHAFIHSPHA